MLVSLVYQSDAVEKHARQQERESACTGIEHNSGVGTVAVCKLQCLVQVVLDFANEVTILVNQLVSTRYVGALFVRRCGMRVAGRMD